MSSRWISLAARQGPAWCSEWLFTEVWLAPWSWWGVVERSPVITSLRLRLTWVSNDRRSTSHPTVSVCHHSVLLLLLAAVYFKHLQTTTCFPSPDQTSQYLRIIIAAPPLFVNWPVSSPQSPVNTPWTHLGKQSTVSNNSTTCFWSSKKLRAKLSVN